MNVDSFSLYILVFVIGVLTCYVYFLSKQLRKLSNIVELQSKLLTLHKNQIHDVVKLLTKMQQTSGHESSK